MAVGGQRDIAGNFECEQGLGRYLERRIKLATTQQQIADLFVLCSCFGTGRVRLSGAVDGHGRRSPAGLSKGSPP